MKCCLGDSLEVAWAETKQLKQELKQHLLFLKKKKENLYPTMLALSQ